MEQDPGKATRAGASGREHAGLLSTASRAKGPKGRDPPGGVLGARTSPEWASIIQAFGPDPRRSGDHQLVFLEESSTVLGTSGCGCPKPRFGLRSAEDARGPRPGRPGQTGAPHSAFCSGVSGKSAQSRRLANEERQVGAEGCWQARGRRCGTKPRGGSRPAVPAASSAGKTPLAKEQVPAEGGRWLRLTSTAGGPQIHAPLQRLFHASCLRKG